MSHWLIEIEAPSSRAEWLAWSIAERLMVAVEQLDQETLTQGVDKATDLLIVRLEEAPSEEQLEGIRACLRALECEGAPLRTRREDDEGWRLGWRAFFKPVEVAPGVVARPPWEPPISEAEVELIIDPGLAFGVGTHPTTRLAAQLVCEELKARPSCKVLDQGAGSGLLAMLAAKLGHEVVGVEMDEMATLSARDNLPLNQLSEAQVKLTVGAEVPKGPFEVVVANIIAPVLIELSEGLREACVGRLILSGMLEAQEAQVLEAYPGWAVERRVSLEGWVGLSLSAKR